MANWNAENIEKFEKILAIVNGKKFVNGTDVTNLYNDVFNRNLRPTNCSSCINQRIKEIRTSYDQYQKDLDKLNALIELDAVMMEDDDDEVKITTKKGRIKKKE